MPRRLALAKRLCPTDAQPTAQEPEEELPTVRNALLRVQPQEESSFTLVALVVHFRRARNLCTRHAPDETSRCATRIRRVAR